MSLIFKENGATDPEYLEFVKLENERLELELHIKSIRDMLDAYKVGMTESLVDAEGYPRADVDVYLVRHRRVQVIRAENDYKKVMRKLEDYLTKYHSKVKPQIEDRSGRPPTLARPPKDLAIVGEVKEGSPSFVAGMRKGDIIMEFGRINSLYYIGLNDFNREVESSINMYIKVVVKRDGQLKRFNLKPKQWSGNGYLGCEILPPQR